MFHYDRGLKLTSIDLAVDCTRRQPRGFISHAHADHMARHELAFCTPATAALVRHRLGELRCKLLAYREPLQWGDMRLTAFPAGHVLGSAMLLAERAGVRLLYTGDFKLGASVTAEAASPPAADLLVMETTYGDRQYRLPPREEVVEAFLDGLRGTILRGRTPVIYAYALGKAQEVTRLLTDAGYVVLQHPAIFGVSQVYETAGCRLGIQENKVRRWPGHPLPGCPVLTPPPHQKATGLPGLCHAETFALTGWAANPRRRRGLRADHTFPLSDHADYQELLELVAQVAPREVYCTHGPASFVHDLRERGYAARELDVNCRGAMVDVGRVNSPSRRTHTADEPRAIKPAI